MAKITPLLLLLLALLNLVNISHSSRRLSSLYEPSPTPLTYHKGSLLQGDVPVSLLWYGNFSPAQKSIVSDFILSITPQSSQSHSSSSAPSASQWWSLVDNLVTKAGKKMTRISISGQVSDEYSLGKLLKRPQLLQLAAQAKPSESGLALVLTAADVSVDGFCMSSCGTHGTLGRSVGAPAYIWVGNSATQCPGQCAWPFHQPVYGPQTPALVAPNGDVGADGMIINIAALLAEAVTNPSGHGYFQGESGGEVGVASACPGVYGPGAYPGYAGELLVDRSTGSSYNVEGIGGRKYLVPALFDPTTSKCSTMV